MQLKWKLCREVEKEHEENERQYAHTFHYRDTICVCRAFWKLPKAYRDGILLHEIGHLLVGPEGSEREATEAAEDYFGAAIEYADSPYGEQLQRIANMARHGVRIINRQRVRNASAHYERGFRKGQYEGLYSAPRTRTLDRLASEYIRTRSAQETQYAGLGDQTQYAYNEYRQGLTDGVADAHARGGGTRDITSSVMRTGRLANRSNPRKFQFSDPEYEREMDRWADLAMRRGHEILTDAEWREFLDLERKLGVGPR